MLNKFKKYKNKFNINKVGILLGAILLTIGLGNGMNKAFAGQGIDSLLSTWFESEKDKAIDDIDKAIEEEVASLSKELKVAVEAEKKKAEDELAAFTKDEKQKRTKALQEYAATLEAKIEIDLTEEKKEIIAELDGEHEQAIKDLNNPTTPIEPTPKPGVEVKPGPTPVPGTEVKPKPGTEVKPDPTPETEDETKPEPALEPEPATKPDPVPETTPESESAE